MAALTAPGTSLTELAGVGPKTIEKLEVAGITSIEKLADMTPEQLVEIPGIGEKMVEKIHQSVAAYFEALEAQASAPAEAATEQAAAQAAPQEASEEASAEAVGTEETAVEDALAESSNEEASAEGQTIARSDDTGEGAVPEENPEKAEGATGE
jgi:N utilization substance protein A